MNRFGDWILKQRSDRGWTQVDLANYLGCEQSMVSRWEAGDAYPMLPRFRSLVRLLCADANKVLSLVSDSRDSGCDNDNAAA